MHVVSSVTGWNGGFNFLERRLEHAALGRKRQLVKLTVDHFTTGSCLGLQSCLGTKRAHAWGLL